MPSSLESCPDNLIESIVELLNLDDIRNLRLTSKTLARKSSQYHLKKYFRTKHIDLTLNDLRRLVLGLQARELRSLVTNFTNLHLTGIVYETDTTFNGGNTPDINALTEAFDELASHCQDGTLSSLTLRVVVIKKDGERITPVKFDGNRYHRWKPIWQCSTKTLNTVACAFAASELKIKSLDIFTDSDMQLCAIACDQLNTIHWASPGLADSLTTLNSLSIRLSARVTEFEQDYEPRSFTRKRARNQAQLRAEVDDESNFPGLSRLLSLCSNLKSFEVIYSRTQTSEAAGNTAFKAEKILQYIVRNKKLPILECCKLRGIFAKEEDLLDFLKRTKASEVSLECVNLRWGSFRSIFDYCTAPEAGITKLYFDSLDERGGHRVYFDINTIRANFSISGSLPIDPSKREEEKQPPWSHDVLIRKGKKVTDPIIHPVPAPMIPGNPWTSERHIFQNNEYGLRCFPN